MNETTNSTNRWLGLRKRQGVHRSVLLLLLFLSGYFSAWGQISGNTEVCQLGTYVYSVPNVSGEYYTWLVNGGTIVSPSSTANQVSVLWDDAGTGQLSLVTQPSGATTTLDVTVLEAPDPFLVPMDNLFCSGGEDYINIKRKTNGPKEQEIILPEYNMDLPCVVACENSSVTYSTPYHAGSTYSWEVVGAASYSVNANEVTVVWGAVGFGNITVAESNASGCTVEDNICIEILNSPEANFETVPAATGGVLNVCSGQTVYFNDLSIDGTQWAWDFGDGFISSTQNPSHTYLIPGTYTVTLTVSNFDVGTTFLEDGNVITDEESNGTLNTTNGGGGRIIIKPGEEKPIKEPLFPEADFTCNCQDTYTLTVIVEDLPAPIIECISTVCALDTATYSTPAACSEYNWSVTGGSIIETSGNSVTVAWGDGSTGPGYLYLNVGDCPGYCDGPAVVRVPIIPTTATISGPDVVCLLSVHRYSIPQVAGMTYNWTVTNGDIIDGAGTNEITVFWSDDTPGIFNVSLTYGNDLLECGGSASLDVQGVPELLINAPARICENVSGSVNPVNTIESVDYGPIASDWSVITPNGTLIENVQLNSSTFTAYNYNAGPGTYIVIAKPSSGLYCNTQVEASIEVVARPIAPAGITGPVSVCPNTNHTYFALGSISNPTFQWTVTNGTNVYTASGSSITVAWGAEGPYSLALTQTDAVLEGCESDPFVLDVNSKYPIDLPTISGDPTACLGGVSHYELLPGLNPDATYQWTVDPNFLGNIITPSNSSGIDVVWGLNGQQDITADIRLEVTVCEITDQVTFQVQLEGYTPDFTNSQPACLESPVSFNGPADGVYFEWAFGDGEFSSDQNPSHEFDAPGSYPVSLFVRNASGCEATIAHVVDVNSSPIASISSPDRLHYLNETCGEDPINVTMYAVQNVSGTYTYNWYKTGSSTSLGNTNPFVATEVGTYYAVVTDSQTGCSSVSNELTVYLTGCGCDIVPEHSADFIFSTTLQSCGEVNFTSIVSSNIRVHSWDFGDPDSGANYSTDENPTHLFSHAGYFRVRMNYIGPKASDPSDSSICYVEQTVFVPIVADFGYNISCSSNNEMVLNLRDGSGTVDGATIDTYSWTLSGPTTVTSNVANPSFAGLPGGNYTVTLTITDNTSGTTCSTVQVINMPSAPSAAMDHVSGTCPGTLVSFTDQSTGSDIINWEWSFGFGIANSNAQNPERTFNEPGTYPIELYVTNKYGCYSLANGTVEVGEPENQPILEGGSTNLCEGQTVTLTAPAGSDYQWSNGETSASITVGVQGVYTVTLTGTNGCSYTTSPVSVTVTPKPTPIVSGTSDLCAGDRITLNTATGYNSYSWQFNQDPTSDNVYTNLSFTGSNINLSGAVTRSGDYRVTVVDANGCSGTSAPFNVTVNPLPNTPAISVDQFGPYCEGTIYTLSVSNPQSGVSYSWSTGQVGESIEVRDAGVYTVAAFGAGGCSRTSGQFVIEELPDVSDVMTGCYEICRSDFPVTVPGPVGYTQYEWYLGSQVVSTEQDLVAEEFGVYYLVLTNEEGCRATSGDIVITRLPEAEVALSATINCCEDNSICEGESATLTVYFGGDGPYTFTYTDGSSTYTVTTSNNPYSLVVSPSQTTSYELLTVTSENESGCFEVCGEATVAVNDCTAQQGNNPNAGEDCSENCFSAEVTRVIDGEDGCRTVEMTVSCDNTCSSSLSNMGISVKCGTVTDMSNNYGFPMFLSDNDPNTGLSGIKIDDISDFCEPGNAESLVISYKVCPNENHCSFDLCDPLVAFKAGTCVNYVSAVVPVANKSVKAENSTVVEAEGMSLQVYPNPFADETLIDLNLTEQSQVSITVYDMMGKKLSVIENGTLDAGKSVYRWNATTDRGELLPAGVYYISTIVNGQVNHVKVMYSK
ncbi:MAG: PKD domain-containing protein [Bacteroidetes bacterium]|nr:MAG: PKD domain-containing protein [Bacteroidota bacterium]